MTDGLDYTSRLERRSDVWWKRILNVQAPYRWNIRRLVNGTVLDVGCGVGRNLAHLDGNGVGVDTNPHSVEVAKGRGLVAYTVDEFEVSSHREGFDNLLFAHVLEHMTKDEATGLVGHYLGCLRTGGKLVVIVPQAAGFASDATHVAFVGRPEMDQIVAANGLVLFRHYSFPFPSFVGRVFKYNETIGVYTKA